MIGIGAREVRSIENVLLESVAPECECFCLGRMYRWLAERTCPMSDVSSTARVAHWGRSHVRSLSIAWPLLQESQRDISIPRDQLRSATAGCDPTDACTKSSWWCLIRWSCGYFASAGWDSECDQSVYCASRVVSRRCWSSFYTTRQSSCTDSYSSSMWWAEASSDGRPDPIASNGASVLLMECAYREGQNLRHWRSSIGRPWLRVNRPWYSIVNAIWSYCEIPERDRSCRHWDDAHW